MDCDSLREIHSDPHISGFQREDPRGATTTRHSAHRAEFGQLVMGQPSPWSWSEDLFHFRGWIYIPNWPSWFLILCMCYNNLATGHFKDTPLGWTDILVALHMP
ncbi:PEG10: Retrotransposon-derived protein PEG10 [Crotalus adamanteus]|uniref:PEG10: Retrotransposon-derived protein PEG10 n=1 Tax=Crotalus adamanteus TaxID=8729 RepID=A0AAW1B4I5_CROAD